MADKSLFLQLPGLTGPSTVIGYTGDFTPDSYSFLVNGGTASVLDLDLGEVAAGPGMPGLYQDALTRKLLTSVTLYATAVAGGDNALVEKIVLTDAIVTSYADRGGDVTVSLDYKTAAVTAYTPNPDGGSAQGETTTFAGPVSVAVGTTEPVPGTFGGRLFLKVPGADGGTAIQGFQSAFALSGYSLGLSTALAAGQLQGGGRTVVDPLIVTMNGSQTEGENKLLAEAQSGTILSSVTLYETNSEDALEYEVVLRNVRVEQEQVTAAGTSFSLNYGAITVTDYTPVGEGPNSTVGASFTETGVTAATVTAAPTEDLTAFSNASLFLQLPGFTGPSTTTGFIGDFTPDSYSFLVNGGAASVLTLDLGEAAPGAGILGLYNDALIARVLSSVTLSVTTPIQGLGNPLVEKIVATNAVVSSYADLGGDVTVSLDYKSAAVTAYAPGFDGTTASTTITVAGPTSVAVGTIEPVPGTASGRLFLKVPGLDGGVTVLGFQHDLALSGYSLGSSTALVPGALQGGRPAVGPLIVTLNGPQTEVEDQLLSDAQSGTILPGVTLYETNKANALEYEVVLQHVRVEQEQATAVGAAFDLNYGTITVTDYTPIGQGSNSNAGASFTQGGVTDATFTAEPTVDLTGESNSSLFLKVPGLTGPSTATGFTGDFIPDSYSFLVNGGGATVVDLDMGEPASGPGMLGLDEDALTGKLLSSVTLYATAGVEAGQALREEIVLTDAVVTTYADLGGDVTVSLDYKIAAVTADTLGPNGAPTTSTTTTVAGPVSVAAGTTEPVPGTPRGLLFLKVPELDGGVTIQAFQGDFALSGYSLGLSTALAGGQLQGGRPVADPLIVTLTGPQTEAEDQLLADVQIRKFLPGVTLYAANGLDALEYEVVLQHVRVEEEQATAAGTSFSLNYGTITVTDYTPNGQSPDSRAGASFTDVLVDTACFCAGTLIRTPSGDVPVERLATGDRIVTLSGAAKPIVWIGNGQVTVRRGRRCAATPVLVRKSALADNVPHRDLRITKGHSLWLDGVLIPVEFLVNHRSILWDDHAQTVVFYHVELAEHGVLFANGVPAESYRDDGNRWLFENANGGWSEPAKPACAPVLTGGPIVDAQWRRLLDRAGPLPRGKLTEDPDLHLLVDGRRIDCLSRPNGNWMFRLPAASVRVRIVSNTAVPAELGRARDPRQLGIALRRIVLRQGTMIRVLMADNPKLMSGFHAFERDNAYRWTDGDALVPTELFAGLAGICMLELVVAETTLYPLLSAA